MGHVCVASPLGPLTLFEDDGAIVAVEWGRAPNGRATPLLKEAARQIEAYFDGKLRDFDLPLKPEGTRFQKAVWARMRKIPYGKTATYGDLAASLQSSPRAVGNACGANPIPVVIPCHRVIGKSGAMVGYSGGEGVDTKAMLLHLEGAASVLL